MLLFPLFYLKIIQLAVAVPATAHASIKMELSTSQKWSYMQMHQDKVRSIQSSSARKGSTDWAHSPHGLATLLGQTCEKSKPLDDLLSELYVSLNTEPRAWIDEFAHAGGIKWLTERISLVVKSHAIDDQGNK